MLMPFFVGAMFLIVFPSAAAVFMLPLPYAIEHPITLLDFGLCSVLAIGFLMSSPPRQDDPPIKGSPCFNLRTSIECFASTLVLLILVFLYGDDPSTLPARIVCVAIFVLLDWAIGVESLLFFFKHRRRSNTIPAPDPDPSLTPRITP